MTDDQIGDLRAEMAANKAEHVAFKERIEKLESSGEERTKILLQLQEQSGAIKTLGDSVKTLADGVGKIDARVSAIEDEPADKWKTTTKKITELILAALVGAIIAYFTGKGI